jgi:ATP/maltotriose-dependent transcriptional regulator MalT/DNA-binding SARP family transcriptional activator
MQNRDKKLLLILGQAAQGKSTLAVSYVKAAQVPSAWVNLGPEDSDPVNFFYLLVNSIQRVLKDIDLSPVLLYPSMIESPREEIPLYREWASVLLEMVSTPLQIIFDGLDRLLADAPAHRFIQVLVEEAPPHLHLIMLSREMPRLEIQALKLRQEAYVLTSEELAFTLGETGKFVRGLRKCRCSPDFLRQIHRSTEGWIGGLVLLCDYLEQAPENSRPENSREEDLEDLSKKFKGEIFQYFGEKIFSTLSLQGQEFLITSSIFDIVEPGFIRDFMGVEKAQEILEDLAQRNLFIQSIYDRRRGWQFRYHQFFRDFLQSKFQTLVRPEQQTAAFLKAGSLFEDRGELEDAVKYYLRAQAYPRAVAVMEQIGVALLQKGRTGDLSQWLQSLPPPLIRENPWLLFYLYATNRFTGGSEYILGLKKALGLFQQQGDTRGSLLSLAYLIEASIFRGKAPIPIETLLAQSEDLLQVPGAESLPYERATLWFQLGFVYPFKFGDPRKGFRACENAYLLAKEVGDIPLQFNALMHAFSNLTYLGEFGSAREMHRKIEKLLGNFTYPIEIQVLYHILSAQYHIIKGELEKAGPLVHKAVEKSETYGLTYLYTLALLYDQLLKIYSGDYGEAAEVGRRLLDLTLSMGNMYLHGVSLFLSGMNQYYRGDPPALAREILDRSRAILAAEETRAVYQMHMLDILMGGLVSHLEEDEAVERNLQAALDHFTGVSCYFLASEAHQAMALWKWRQGRVAETAKHLQAGCKIAAAGEPYAHQYLSRKDHLKACLLALELEITGVEDYLAHLLTTYLASLAGPELAKLFEHPNPKIAQRARDLGQAIHRAGLPRLRLKTLGTFQTLLGTSAIEENAWGGRQPKLLLKNLIAHGGAFVVKDQVLEDLWPESPPAEARQSFKTNLHRLRKALEPDIHRIFGSSYLRLKANLLSLDQELCTVDADEFLCLSRQGEERERKGDIRGALNSYKNAVELYGGDFLPEEPYAPWAERKRQELRERYLEIFYRLAGLHEKQGASLAAIDAYKRLLLTEPTWEQACQRLMILYGNRGMRSAALGVYEDCRKALMKELNVEPDAVTAAIYQKILGSGQGQP